MVIHPNSVVIPSEARDLLFHGAKQYIRSPTHSRPTAPVALATAALLH
jgi:hypothetical protein